MLAGEGDNAKRRRETHATEADALAAASAEWQRIQRGAATLSLRLARGRAELSPEQRARLSGFKVDINGTNWIITKVRHAVDGATGFTTELDLEREM
ncbi:hypothetical protein [Coralloluteibacterium stylophorae]|uniref:Uncharacterized protein n=1 Tax=Coralloluteibacterium stylophorae TaxID=1776034 RepID=A0A8J7VQW9_9GAMM|nr:hypothetical protein [Coralloluteibacterium stylophorae]MBS7457176.1 hypothetical protein [Coralloluteibacterium stylophorae]